MFAPIKVSIAVAAFFFAATATVFPQNALFIPDTLSGTIFNLSVQTGTKTFFTGYTTPTYGYNGNFLGPTLLINRGDTITLNVSNNLPVATTVHWHGFHVTPENDGGPHISIAPGETWSPTFEMLNNAATYWYHPHGESKTEIQVSRGLAGLIIVRDSKEATYTLPREYGTDDFPLILQSRAFDVLYQIATANHEDSIMMVNGTIDPFLEVPKQVVRFRLLNGSADRTYNLGLSDDSNFYMIASDGGLLSQPHLTNRLRLSPGERAEILVNFGSYEIGNQFYLKSYASELHRGIIGADSVGTSSLLIGEGYYTNKLNGANFNILRFDIVATTNNPVTTIPDTFDPLILLDTLDVNEHRHLHFAPDTSLFGLQAYVDGPFHINNQFFDMGLVNITTYLGNKEIWTLTNSTLVAHPFHIHDIQFFVLDINGAPPPPQYSGFKDVILVKPNDTIRFITKFETFSSNVLPYMYHCHLLHHEDEGMMGSFLVLDTTLTDIKENIKENMYLMVYPNPSSSNWTIEGKLSSNKFEIKVFNIEGQLVYQAFTEKDYEPFAFTIDNSSLTMGVYYLQVTSSFGTETRKLLKAN